MGRIAFVDSSELIEVDGAKTLNVIFEPGGGASETADNFAPPGVDAPPLPGDAAIVVDTEGGGDGAVVGYIDEGNAGVAVGGEYRTYGRDASGVIVSEVWQKADGSVLVKNDAGQFELKADGTIVNNEGTVSAVQFDGLKTAFDTLKGEYDNFVVQFTKLYVYLNTTLLIPGTPVTPIPVVPPVSSLADIGPAESDTVKVP